MLDIYIPYGALDGAAEEALVRRITDILIANEGFDPDNPDTRAVSWAFVHRPVVYVGGERADVPRYRVVPSVPEGQLDAKARERVIAEVTDAILAAEHGRWPTDPGRVWVFPTDIPEGHWGGRGRVMTLSQILARLTGDETRARRLAEQRIANSRLEKSRAFT